MYDLGDMFKSCLKATISLARHGMSWYIYIFDHHYKVVWTPPNFVADLLEVYTHNNTHVKLGEEIKNEGQQCGSIDPPVCRHVCVPEEGGSSDACGDTCTQRARRTMKFPPPP